MAHQDYIMEVAGPRGNVLVRVFAPQDTTQTKIKEVAFARVNGEPEPTDFDTLGLLSRAVGTFYQLETMPTVNLTADPVPQLYGPQQSRPETIERMRRDPISTQPPEKGPLPTAEVSLSASASSTTGSGWWLMSYV